MADRRYRLDEIADPQRRLGRHVQHDPRSLQYLVVPKGTAVVPRSVTWERHAPTLNQGNLGSCVTNTGTEILSCAPFWNTLPAGLQATLSNADTAEQWAVQLYRDVTRADPFPGAWEPTDTGSDGLSLAKVLKARGLISGYQHATSLAGIHAALQRGPVAVGTVWLSDMNNPSREGIIRATGAVEGGHEWTLRQYDLERDLWWLDNHWTGDWGLAGRAAMSSADLQKLLDQQGDAVSFTPLDQPAPAPAPPAAPVTPTAPVVPPFPLVKVQPFLDDPHRYARATRASDAIKTWLEAVEAAGQLP